MRIGVFYRVFHVPKREGSTSRVLNFDIPSHEDPERYPIVEVARIKLDRLYPDAKTIIIVATSRDGAIETDEPS